MASSMEDREERAQDLSSVHDERSPLLSQTSEQKRKRSHGSLIAIVSLIILAALTVIFGFIIPQTARTYIEKTIQVEPQSVKLLEVQDGGALLNVTVNVSLDHNKSDSAYGRRITKLLLGIVGPVKVKDTDVEIHLNRNQPHYIGRAQISPFTIVLHSNALYKLDLEVYAELKDASAISDLVQDILQNRVDQIPIKAVVHTKLHKFLTISRTITQSIDYTIPEEQRKLPAYNLTNVKVQDMSGAGIAATAELAIDLALPIQAEVPILSLDLAIPGCGDEAIVMAQAANEIFKIMPNQPIQLRGLAQCPAIPVEALLKCPDSEQSPLDRVVEGFLKGAATTILVAGSNASVDGSSSWIQDLLSTITLPVEIPGSKNDQLARDIELLDIKFNLPSLIGGGSSKPQISGRIKGTIDIPKEIDISVKVKSVHVLADLIYKGENFAYVESPGWAPALSDFPKKSEMVVQVLLKDAPVTITNQDVFSTIVSQLFSGKVFVDVNGTADLRVTTGLGEFEAHKLPIEARDIEIGGLGFLHTVKPLLHELGVQDTSATSLDLTAAVEIKNPTHYSAVISDASVLLSYGVLPIGYLVVHRLVIQPGNNDLRAAVQYSPASFDNIDAGEAMLSSYLSERPTNISLSFHQQSFRHFPTLSKALAKSNVTFELPIPQLQPSTTLSSTSRFLIEAKFHVFSSTASFTLRNPLNTTIMITHLSAFAIYHDDVIGRLRYDYPILLYPSTDTETTRLPVKWSLPASDILRRVIGGTLKVNATANATVSIGKMHDIHLQLSLQDVGAGVGI